jgi:hypothetical protein
MAFRRASRSSFIITQRGEGGEGRGPEGGSGIPGTDGGTPWGGLDGIIVCRTLRRGLRLCFRPPTSLRPELPLRRRARRRSLPPPAQ